MSPSVDGAKAIVGLRPSEESRMKSTNAGGLDGKSGVRLGERRAPVTAAGLDSRWTLTQKLNQLRP